MAVECAFGIYTNRWRVFGRRVERKRLVNIRNMAQTCALLHNFLVSRKEPEITSAIDGASKAPLLRHLSDWKQGLINNVPLTAQDRAVLKRFSDKSMLQARVIHALVTTSASRPRLPGSEEPAPDDVPMY